jgi:hypothetical protein
MPAWIIKSETYDPDRALEIVQDQRAKGYNAWIEDENGVAWGRFSLLHPLLPVSLFFTWLVCGLTITNFNSFAATRAASPRWPRSFSCKYTLGSYVRA